MAPQHLHDALADVRAVLQILDADVGTRGITRGDDALHGRFAKAVDGREGTAQVAILDQKALWVALVQVHGQHVNATHLHLQQHVIGVFLLLLAHAHFFLAVLEIGEAVAQGFRAEQHAPRVKSIAANGEVGRIVRLRTVHLVPRHTKAHGYIGHGMAAREHVLDLVAAVDGPLGHVVLAHGLLPFGFEPAALAHAFHDVEAHLLLHALGDQEVHDVVAGTEALSQLGRAGIDDVLRVAQPHVRSVRETGDADEFLHGGGPRLHEHATHEARAELRDAQRAGFPHDLLLGDAQGFGAGKQAHHLAVVQRDFTEVDAGELLQPVHHGRIVVAQTVELDQNVVHGVEVVVRGDGGAFHVVGGMLDGRKLADVIFLGQHHDAAGVLACGALNAHTARRQPFLVGAARMDASLLQVLGGKAVGRLFREAGDGAGAVDVALAEELLDVGMGARLVFA